MRGRRERGAVPGRPSTGCPSPVGGVAIVMYWWTEREDGRMAVPVPVWVRHTTQATTFDRCEIKVTRVPGHLGWRRQLVIRQHGEELRQFASNRIGVGNHAQH
jgi:hypothetical protein